MGRHSVVWLDSKSERRFSTYLLLINTEKQIFPTLTTSVALLVRLTCLNSPHRQTHMASGSSISNKTL